MSGGKHHDPKPATAARHDAPSFVQTAAAPAAATAPAVPAAQAPPAAQATTHQAAQIEAAPKLDERTPLLSKLLHIADMYRAEDSVHQAMSIYFELAEEHAGAPEAYDALERLLDIAKKYEDAGEIRQARSLYERLL